MLYLTVMTTYLWPHLAYRDLSIFKLKHFRNLSKAWSLRKDSLIQYLAKYNEQFSNFKVFSPQSLCPWIEKINFRIQIQSQSFKESGEISGYLTFNPQKEEKT